MLFLNYFFIIRNFDPLAEYFKTRIINVSVMLFRFKAIIDLIIVINLLFDPIVVFKCRVAYYFCFECGLFKILFKHFLC